MTLSRRRLTFTKGLTFVFFGPPSTPSRKPDGTVVHTLWGELAYQLGKSQGYALAKESDINRSAPGTGLFSELIGQRPTLIMLDELARHMRAAQSVPTATGKSDLAEQTVAAYAADLRRYLGFLEARGLAGWDRVRREDILDHLIALRQDGLSARSLARHLSAIRGFHGFLQEERLVAVRKRAAFRTAAPGQSVIAPEVVASGAWPEHAGDPDGIGGHVFEGARGMHAEVGIGHPLALVVHAEEVGVLVEQRTREEIGHGMEFVFHVEAQFAAGIEEQLAVMGLDELGDVSREGVEGDGGEPGAPGAFRPVEGQVRRRDDHAAGGETGPRFQGGRIWGSVHLGLTPSVNCPCSIPGKRRDFTGTDAVSCCAYGIIAAAEFACVSRVVCSGECSGGQGRAVHAGCGPEAWGEGGQCNWCRSAGTRRGRAGASASGA